MEKSQFFKISLEIQNEIMTPKSEFGSRVKFFFWKFSLEMIEFILIRNPNEILRVKLSKLGFHFQNFIPYKKRPQAVSYSSQILKVKFFTLDDDELVDPSFQNQKKSREPLRNRNRLGISRAETRNCKIEKNPKILVFRSFSKFDSRSKVK